MFILFGRDTTTLLWIPKGTAFCISKRHVLAAYHCTLNAPSSEYEELCLGRTASCNDGAMFGHVNVQRTPHRDTHMDWIILERADEAEFPHCLTLCDIANLPKVDERVRACFAPIDLITNGCGSILEVTAGDYCRIQQYSPEVSGEPHIGFMAKPDRLQSPREDPQYIYMSVDGGLYGGCCGSPYLDKENRVVAFHLYSGDDMRPMAEIVSDAIAKSARRSKRQLDCGSADADSSSGGHAHIKQGLIIAKLESLVRAIRALFGTELNSTLGIDIAEGKEGT